jgi:mRNA interferase MazF
MAQITKAKQSSWPGDLKIRHVEAGLPEDCIVRMKLFTIDNRLIQRRTGSLSAADRESVRAGLGQVVPA